VTISLSSLGGFWRKPIFLAFITTILAVLIYNFSPFFSRIDLIGRDIIFQLRHTFRHSPGEIDQLVLVTIDDMSIERMKQKWPWPRAIYADAVTKINSAHPKVIGFDFVFQGEDQTIGSDELLLDALSKAGNVVLASYLSHDGRLISAQPAIQEAAFRTALVNKIVDRDGVIRRAPLLFNESKTKQITWSWESEIFLKAYDFKKPRISEYRTQTVIESEGRRIQIPAAGGVLDIDYTATLEDFHPVPFWKLAENKIDPALFKDKIVLIGLTALASHDFHPTPLQLIAGLALNANTVLTLIRQHFLIRTPLFVTWILLFLTLWLILRAVDRYSILTSFFIIAAASCTYLLVSLGMLWWNVIWDLSFATVVCILGFFFAVLLKQFQTALENIKLREESVRDPLTGFYTRRFLEVHLKMDVKKVLSSSRGFGSIDEVSVVMIDLDNFKLVNDSFGHQEGDRVLKRLGESIRSSVRKDELVCRFGGDEFCVILPGVTLENAVQFSEKLRLLIVGDPELNYTTQAGVKSFRVTGSFGVASVKGAKTMNPDNLLKAADRALYRAKKGGRNQVCTFDPDRDVLDGD